MNPPELLPEWAITSEDLQNEFVVAQHQLSESLSFDDEQLIEFLGRHPREHLGVSAMGTDPTKPDEWRAGEAGDLGARELIEAVKEGRLWLNLRRSVDVHPEIRDLVSRLYDEMEQKTPGLKTFNHSSNLLISSPSAIVYYHMDCPVNMLWHLRGRKRVWAYPVAEQYLPTSTVESVIAGTSSEEISYDAAWDQDAFVVDLEPGQMITWPQHSPHRVVNTDGLNVSLSTEHYTRDAIRKNNVHLANRHFRSWNPAWAQSTDIHGFSPWLKEVALRACRRIPGLQPEQPTGYEYPKSFVVDLRAPNCTRTSAATESLV